MSSPLAAGVGATLLGQGMNFTTAFGLCEKMIDLSTKGIIKGLTAEDNNRLVYNGNGV
jgi:hypothetical protein